MRLSILCLVLITTACAVAQTRTPRSIWEAKYREIERDFTRKDSKRLTARLVSNYKLHDPTPEERKKRFPSAEPPPSAKFLWNHLKVLSVEESGDKARVRFAWGYRYNYTPDLTPEQRMWESDEPYRIRVHLMGTDSWKRRKGKWLLVRTDFAERKREANTFIEDDALAKGKDYLALPPKKP
jgi:hypothetical protein